MIRQISILGTGTMGRGIAYLSAVSGFDTVIYDVDISALDAARASIESTLQKGVEKGKVDEDVARAAMARVTLAGELEPAVTNADLIIEAVPESLELKVELLAQADVFCGPETILASNTSSISITRLAANVERRDRFVGMHFFNPAHIIKLVEVVVGPGTSPEALATARELGVRLGKDPIVVRDSPGFASSRLGLALGLEAMRMLEDGVASAEDIDKAMSLGYGHPMGPLKLTDLVGLDVRLSIAEYLEKELGPAFSPPRILREHVAAGRLGKKTGEGFYLWDGETTLPRR